MSDSEYSVIKNDVIKRYDCNTFAIKMNNKPGIKPSKVDESSELKIPSVQKGLTNE